MIETIDARCTIPRLPYGVDHLWHFRRNASGTKTWTHPKPPDGVSLLSVTLTPAGECRARMEGNITALYAGTPHAAIASLSADELPGALDAFHGVADELLERTPVPTPQWWDVHRLDPSVTYLLPDAIPATTVVEAVRRSWDTHKRKSDVLSAHNGETATLRLSKHQSWTVYSKGAEALSKANPLLRPGWESSLLRFESRLRPRLDKSEARKDWNPTLALTETDLQHVTNELDALGEALAKVSATQGLMQVRAFLRAGASPNEAMRLTTVATLVATFGPAVLVELGVPDRTAERWRADVKRFLSQVGGTEEDVIDDLPNAVRLSQRLSLADVLRDELP